MSEEMRTFGYLCPQCGKTVMGTRSVFALEASNAEVECACGKSALKVAFDGTEYHIYVPCGICGETHEAHCPPERVLHGATALGCAKTKQFCCFIGPEGTVEKNLRDLAVLAEKNLHLVGKLNHLSGRTIRERLLAYLEELSDRTGRRTVTVPFDRQALADYLCVDRSALSRTIGALQREGVLTADRTRFTLHNISPSGGA